MTFGERVKQVRLALNLSQEEMAKELGGILCDDQSLGKQP